MARAARPFWPTPRPIGTDQGGWPTCWEPTCRPSALQIRYIQRASLTIRLELVRIDRQGDKLVRVPDVNCRGVSVCVEALSLTTAGTCRVRHQPRRYRAQRQPCPCSTWRRPFGAGGQLRGVVVVRGGAVPAQLQRRVAHPLRVLSEQPLGRLFSAPDAMQTFGLTGASIHPGSRFRRWPRWSMAAPKRRYSARHR